MLQICYKLFEKSLLKEKNPKLEPSEDVWKMQTFAIQA